MSLAPGCMLFMHCSELKSRAQADTAGRPCSKDFSPSTLAPVGSHPSEALLPPPCRCRCSANHAGLFEGQQFHVLSKCRTLRAMFMGLQPLNEEQGRNESRNAHSRSLRDLLGSSMAVRTTLSSASETSVLFSALPCASFVTQGKSQHPSPNPHPFQSCSKDNAWEGIF